MYFNVDVIEKNGEKLFRQTSGDKEVIFDEIPDHFVGNTFKGSILTRDDEQVINGILLVPTGRDGCRFVCSRSFNQTALKPIEFSDHSVLKANDFDVGDNLVINDGHTDNPEEIISFLEQNYRDGLRHSNKTDDENRDALPDVLRFSDPTRENNTL